MISLKAVSFVVFVVGPSFGALMGMALSSDRRDSRLYLLEVKRNASLGAVLGRSSGGTSDGAAVFVDHFLRQSRVEESLLCSSCLYCDVCFYLCDCTVSIVVSALAE